MELLLDMDEELDYDDNIEKKKKDSTPDQLNNTNQNNYSHSKNSPHQTEKSDKPSHQHHSDDSHHHQKTDKISSSHSYKKRDRKDNYSSRSKTDRNKDNKDYKSKKNKTNDSRETKTKEKEKRKERKEQKQTEQKKESPPQNPPLLESESQKVTTDPAIENVTQPQPIENEKVENIIIEPLEKKLAPPNKEEEKIGDLIYKIQTIPSLETVNPDQEPPRFSELKTHIFLKNLRLVENNISKTKEVICNEYRKLGYDPTMEYVYLEKQKDGSYVAHFGFRRDFEAFHVIKMGITQSKIKLLLFDGRIDHPDFEVSYLFHYMISKTQSILEDQVKKHFSPSLNPQSPHSKSVRSRHNPSDSKRNRNRTLPRDKDPDRKKDRERNKERDREKDREREKERYKAKQNRSPLDQAFPHERKSSHRRSPKGRFERKTGSLEDIDFAEPNIPKFGEAQNYLSTPDFQTKDSFQYIQQPIQRFHSQGMQRERNSKEDEHLNIAASQVESEEPISNQPFMIPTEDSLIYGTEPQIKGTSIPIRDINIISSANSQEDIPFVVEKYDPDPRQGQRFASPRFGMYDGNRMKGGYGNSQNTSDALPFRQEAAHNFHRNNERISSYPKNPSDSKHHHHHSKDSRSRSREAKFKREAHQNINQGDRNKDYDRNKDSDFRRDKRPIRQKYDQQNPSRNIPRKEFQKRDMERKDSFQQNRMISQDFPFYNQQESTSQNHREQLISCTCYILGIPKDTGLQDIRNALKERNIETIQRHELIKKNDEKGCQCNYWKLLLESKEKVQTLMEQGISLFQHPALVIAAKPDQSVEQIVRQFQAGFEIPPEQQHLLSPGEENDFFKLLSTYGKIVDMQMDDFPKKIMVTYSTLQAVQSLLKIKSLFYETKNRIQIQLIVSSMTFAKNVRNLKDRNMSPRKNFSFEALPYPPPSYMQFQQYNQPSQSFNPQRNPANQNQFSSGYFRTKESTNTNVANERRTRIERKDYQIQ